MARGNQIELVMTFGVRGLELMPSKETLAIAAVDHATVKSYISLL